MDLAKLFEMQKVLRDRINYNEPDRFNKLVLALLVELGECANEWRGFKFWSRNQEPKVKAQRIKDLSADEYEFETFNPLLEEYVDGKHFLLELGIELGVGAEPIEKYIGNRKKKIGSLEYHFGYLYNRISELMDSGSDEDKRFKLLQIFNAYIGLGYRLGFTWEQIEQAYFEKNKVNHQRQDSGY